MSVILRVLPDIATRSIHHLSTQTRPLFHLNRIILQPVLRKSFCAVSASTTEPVVSNLPTTSKEQRQQSVPGSVHETPTLEWVNRNGLCGELSEKDVGREVRLCGWVALHRGHGGLTFINLRDHSGIVQLQYH
ncbi:putative aspartate--tRNA(Asn) ligase [Helianthus annuus]|nr:putative aspartate--tRNA(Asn) ligase [Helianthus annuus]